MRRLTVIASMVLGALGILAIPSSALATGDCTYANNTTHGGTQTTSTNGVPLGVGGYTVTVYSGSGGTGTAGTTAAGACVDNGDSPAADFEGGSAEVGAGDDPQTAAQGDGATPDAYAVVDGDQDNVDPTGQSDGYIGVSNYETGSSRTTQADCERPNGGPYNGAAGSSNSGGCLGFRNWGTYVYVPGDVPTPVCGNTSGNDWTGSGNTEGAGYSDGCDPVEMFPF